jgi:hypothetical protein
VSANTVDRALDLLKDENVIDDEKIEPLYQIGFEFAGHVLNNYWLLKENITQVVNNFIQKEFSGHYMIGLQMRFTYLDEHDAKVFISCAQMIEHLNEKIIGDRSVKWFVSTDNKAVFDEQIKNLDRNYTEKIVRVEGNFVGHVAENSNAYERTLIDIELLSHCDEVIITGGSTFGFISSLKKQKIPFFVEGYRSMKECQIFKFFSPPRTPKGYAIFR